MKNHQSKWERIRRKERMRLFLLAKGNRPWHAQVVTQAIIALLGLGFVVFGVVFDIHAVAVIWQALPLTLTRGEKMVLGVFSTVGGMILLVETVLVLPRRLRQLPSVSAAHLRDRLLREELAVHEPHEA